MPISKVKGWLVLQTVEMASLLAVWIIEGLFKVEYCAAESGCRRWLRDAQPPPEASSYERKYDELTVCHGMHSLPS